MLNKQQVSHWISFSAIPLSILWFFLEPSVEPIIIGLYGINNSLQLGMPWNYRKYAFKRTEGTVSFNFTKNGGKCEFGADETYFEVVWSPSSASSVQAYGRTPSVKKLSVVTDKPGISDIPNASSYEYTDHERPQKGEILLLMNRFDNFAAIKIVDIKDRSRGSEIDELTIQYVINPPGIVDFR